MSNLHLLAALEVVDNAKSICGEGKTDVKHILRTLVNGPQKEETYCIGQKIRHIGYARRESYLLASCTPKNVRGEYVVAVYPDGRKAIGAIKVGDVFHITRSEMDEIMGGLAWELASD